MIPPELADLLQQISILALPAIFAITLHEAAHGYAAHRFGDDTAWRQGRVTFNPARHIDPFGTILLPLLLFFVSGGKALFGYAKPVPVAFDRLRHPRRDMVWVALAGPATNILLAVLSALLLHVVPYAPRLGAQWLEANLVTSLEFNIILAVFNMIPLPPLDGGRVAVGLLPDALAFPLARAERYGLLILIGLMLVLPMIGARAGIDLNLLWHVVEWPSNLLLHAILQLTGVSA